GFSSLVDSNTEAATAHRDDSGRQTGDDQGVPSRGDDANSTPAITQNGGKPPPHGDTKKASNTNAKSGSDTPATDASGQAQTADTSAATGPATTADTVVVQVIATDAATQGATGQGDGKDKPSAKGDATGDSTDPAAARTAPGDQTTTLVVAVVAEI